MKRTEYEAKIRELLGLDEEKCILFFITDKTLRIFFDNEIKQHDIDLIEYKMRNCCDVRVFNPHTLDLMRRHSLENMVAR